jgi:hypothetical protein
MKLHEPVKTQQPLAVKNHIPNELRNHHMDVEPVHLRSKKVYAPPQNINTRSTPNAPTNMGTRLPWHVWML